MNTIFEWISLVLLILQLNIEISSFQLMLVSSEVVFFMNGAN
jgi:hypothetical protein